MLKAFSCSFQGPQSGVLFVCYVGVFLTLMVFVQFDTLVQVSTWKSSPIAFSRILNYENRLNPSKDISKYEGGLILISIHEALWSLNVNAKFQIWGVIFMSRNFKYMGRGYLCCKITNREGGYIFVTRVQKGQGVCLCC